jgi:hypothetical protein
VNASTQRVITLDTIRLKQLDIQLMEVVVKTAKAALRMNGDTLEYDVSQFKVPPGTDVEGLLRQLPGIKIDQNGNVVAQGKQVEILVEGKKFFSGNTQMATKNLLADMLTVVQVYDDQTEFSRLTGLDDGNKTRKLNLKLKEIYKNMTFGQVYGGIGSMGRNESKISVNRFTDKQQFSVLAFGNNVNQHSIGYGEYENFYGKRLANVALFGPGTTNFLSYGLPNLLYTGNTAANGNTKSYGMGANYNRFGKKTKITANYYQNRSNMVQESLEDLRYILPESSYSVGNNNTRKLIRSGKQVSANVEHEINSHSKIVLNMGINDAKDKNDYSKDETYLNNRNEMVSDGRQSEDNITKNAHLYITSFYNYRFKKKGKSLSVSSTYKTNTGDNSIQSMSDVIYFQPADSVYSKKQNIKTSQNNHHLTGGILYGQNINSFLTLQSYANYGSSNANARFTSNDLLNNEQTKDSSLIKTNYQINFTRLGSQMLLFRRKFSMTVGISGQQFWLKGKNQFSEMNTSTIDTRFGNVAPNVSVNYTFKIFNTTASYVRGLEAPSFSEIQPFRFTNDPRNIIIGNPKLLGRAKDEYSLFFSGFFDKTNTQLYIGAQYSVIMRDIVQSRTVNEDLVTVYQFVNVSSGSSALIYSGYNRPLVKNKLTLDLTYSIGKYATITPINHVPIKTNHWMHQPSIRLNWTLGKILFLSQGFSMISNIYHYSAENEADQKMLRLNTNTDLSLRLPGEIYFSGKFNLVTNRSETNNFNQTMPILNSSLSKSFLKSKNLALRISAYDILNKRQDISLSSYQNVISIRRSTILSRYYMLTLTYNIRGVKLNLKNL